MSSNIVPGNIDGTYPIAGIDNDSQGFRTNFTNTVTNFTNARDEIQDLQTKAIIKAPLNGDVTTDNDMGGTILKAASVVDFREKIVNHSLTESPAYTIDHTSGHYHIIPTTTENINLTFANFPTSDLGKVRVQIQIANSVHTVTLPGGVQNGLDGIELAVGPVLGFGAPGVYIFEFTSTDGSAFTIQDLTRSPLSAGSTTTKLEINPGMPATSLGTAGDIKGTVIYDSTYLYICVADYDGTSDIWTRVLIDLSPF